MSKVSRGKASPLSPLHPPSADSVDSAEEGAPPKSGGDSFSQASGQLNKASKMMVKSALTLFGDNVILPASLTDPKNPANDPKYHRLFSAVLGLGDLEKYFYTLGEGEAQEAYWEHKKEQRKAKLLKIKREKEEKEREKRQAASDSQAQDEEEEGEEEA